MAGDYKSPATKKPNLRIANPQERKDCVNDKNSLSYRSFGFDYVTLR